MIHMKKSVLAIGLIAVLGLSACCGMNSNSSMNCPHHKAGQTCMCKECKQDMAHCKCKHAKEVKGCPYHAKQDY
jgi:hypothetical protein